MLHLSLPSCPLLPPPYPLASYLTPPYLLTPFPPTYSLLIPLTHIPPSFNLVPYLPPCPLLTPLIRSRRGSSQPTLHSQWLSKKVRIGALAASAPFTRDLIRPSRFSLRMTFTFFILANSSPSEATNIKCKQFHLTTHEHFNDEKSANLQVKDILVNF